MSKLEFKLWVVLRLAKSMLNWGLFDFVEILHLIGFQDQLITPKALLIYGRYCLFF